MFGKRYTYKKINLISQISIYQWKNSLITKYIQPLKEGRHENFNGVHSNGQRGQAGNIRKKMSTEGCHKQSEN